MLQNFIFQSKYQTCTKHVRFLFDFFFFFLGGGGGILSKMLTLKGKYTDPKFGIVVANR